MGRYISFYDLPLIIVPPLQQARSDGDVSATDSLFGGQVSTDASSKIQHDISQMAKFAAENGQPDVLSFCLSSGLRLKSDHPNVPMICAACDSGSVVIVRVLLKEGAWMSTNT